MIVQTVFGLSDGLAGVILGWALTTVFAVGTGAINLIRRRRHENASRRTAARLLLQELRVAQLAADGDDPRLFAAGKPLPTDVWNQRRHQLIETDDWEAIADAFTAIETLNARREAHLIWRNDEKSQELRQAMTEIKVKLADADSALRRIAT